jgi:hypothetical protein
MSRLALYDRHEIERYIRSLRHAQKRSWSHGGEDVVERLLAAHGITVEPGTTDYYEGADTPLDDWLSLLDDDSRRQRVSLVWIELAELGVDEMEVLIDVVGAASAAWQE